MMKQLKVLALGDQHAPFQDNKAIELACMLIEAIKPDQIIDLGDACDFAAVSVFDKSPSRVTHLQQEMDEARAVNARLSSASNAKWTHLWGNHEKRWSRYLNKHPEIFGLECLDISNQLGWDLVENIQIGDTLFTHGKRVSKHPGRAVMAELQDRLFQCNMVIGHGHRTGSYIVKGHTGVVKGFEVGCLASLTPDWKPVNNWTQSILLLTIKGKNIGAEQIIFEDKGRRKQCIWRDKLWRV